MYAFRFFLRICMDVDDLRRCGTEFQSVAIETNGECRYLDEWHRGIMSPWFWS